MRKTLSKKLRFEIFKRDNFKCVYCGAMAVTSTLECDHVIPVCKGGSNDSLNLVTACLNCNRGKSGTEISDNTRLTIEKEISKHKKTQIGAVKKALEKSKSDKLYKREVAGVYLDFLNEETELIDGRKWVFTEKIYKRFYVLHENYEKSEIFEAISVSVKQYYKKDGIDLCVDKVGGILFIRDKSKNDPVYAHYCKTRGKILKKWTFVDRRLRDYFYKLCEANTPESVSEFCLQFNNWSSFRDACKEVFNG